jgi:RimJ/RimL family protein N-acetyltransferase
MFRLETDRLLLRPFTPGDAEDLAAYRSDPDIARYQGWDSPYPVDRARDLIRSLPRPELPLPGEWSQIAIELRATGRLAGDCAFKLLRENTRQAEIGLTLARPFHGRGYGQEAVTRLLQYLFDQLGLHRGVANCDVENRAAARVLERLGFRREAHFLENLWFKGRWSSEYWYAMLEREWRANKAARGSSPWESTPPPQSF